MCSSIHCLQSCLTSLPISNNLSKMCAQLSSVKSFVMRMFRITINILSVLGQCRKTYCHQKGMAQPQSEIVILDQKESFAGKIKSRRFIIVISKLSATRVFFDVPFHYFVMLQTPIRSKNKIECQNRIHASIVRL